MKRALLCGLVGAFAAMLLVGCSKKGPVRPATYPVTGTVTFKGAPLEGAQVVFVPKTQGGQGATGLTDQSGKYSLGTFQAKDGAQEGEYLVKVIKTDAKLPPPAGNPVNLSHEEEQKIYNEAPPAAPPKSLIPKKYDNEGTSGLTHTVPKQASTFDITLQE
jgi:hypothetical protein